MDLLFGGGGGGGEEGARQLPSQSQPSTLQAAAFLASHSTATSQDMNGPMLYTEANRSSAIDDVRSGILYVFIVTIFVSFLLILPGVRNDKLPTFFCVTSSLLVASVILIGLLGTTWHVGNAPHISAAYKAFSRDRIQGELSVKIGLNSVNITLAAHKYFVMHEHEGPIVLMEARATTSKRASLLANLMPLAPVSTMRAAEEPSEMAEQNSGTASEFIAPNERRRANSSGSLADELLEGHTSDGISVDAELESEEAFGESEAGARRLARSSQAAAAAQSGQANSTSKMELKVNTSQRNKRDNNQPLPVGDKKRARSLERASQLNGANRMQKPKYTVRKVNHVDINYNERFYWIEPQQMRREYERALQRGLPYPILTVVEYLSQDEAGFNWSRQYRVAGYYASILLKLAACLCVLMFCLHCAAPKYGIYTMQLLGCLLLFTNLTYSTLVPRGDKQLVIPFEGQRLTFQFGPSFWLVLAGGCISLGVGTIIVIIDKLFPNFIFTTLLDVDYDSHQDYYMKQKYFNDKKLAETRAKADSGQVDNNNVDPMSKRPELPPFLLMKKAIVMARRDGQILSSRSSSSKQTDKSIVKTNSENSDTTARSETNSGSRVNDGANFQQANPIGQGDALKLHLVEHRSELMTNESDSASMLDLSNRKVEQHQTAITIVSVNKKDHMVRL